MTKYRLLWIIPNGVTFTSIFLGLLAITWAVSGRYYAAAIALLFASICDLLDGMLARKFRVDSEFGVELDSLADFLSAGVAPAMLVYYWSLQHVIWAGVPVGLVVVFVYVLCIAGRLARFNVQTAVSESPKLFSEENPSKPNVAMFTGIPSPAGALLLATVVMVHDELNFAWLRDKMFLIPYLLVVGALLISKLPYRSFKSFKTRLGPFVFGGSILGGLTVLAFGGPGGAILLSVMIWYILTGLYAWLQQKIAMPSKTAVSLLTTHKTHKKDGCDG